jgi:hypothetical protein
MKMLSALFVALVILGICTSSYGYFLVYNLSGTIRGVDDANAVTIPFGGYLVMNFNDGTNSLVDANMIIYGRDPNGHKVYVRLNSHDSNEFLDAHILPRDVRNFYVLNGESPFGFRSVIMGNVNRTTIGPSNRRYIAPALKGVIREEEGIFLDLEHDLAGVGSISASLYTTETKMFNDPGTLWTQDTIIDELKGILAEKHYTYTEVNKPAPI